MRRIQALIFDLDGLMIDTEPLARKAWDRVVEDHGKRLDDQTFNSMIGLRLEESSLVVREKLGLGTEPGELARMEQEYMSQIMAEGVPVMEGLGRRLRTISQRKLPWAGATSSRHTYAAQALKQHKLFERCGAIAGGDEVERGKPAPDVYLLAAERLGVDPEYCLALEDSVPGVLSARAAGMIPLAVPNGHTSQMDFKEAAYVYSSLVEVAADLETLLETVT